MTSENLSHNRAKVLATRWAIAAGAILFFVSAIAAALTYYLALMGGGA